MSALAEDLARALDPVALSERVGLVPDSWQVDVLRSRASRVLLNCARQSGKSTIAAILAMHAALYEPGSLVLVVSPSRDQSQELFRHALAAYRTLGRPVPPEAENRLALELETGSRIVSLPGSEPTVRGYAGVGLLIVDEAARVPDELYFTVRPMLAVSRGRLIAMSTPHGRRGWWFHAWIGEETWERYEVPATDCPRISSDYLEQERRSLGEWWFRQEYLCEFADAETQAFTSAEVEALFDPELVPWSL